MYCKITSELNVKKSRLNIVVKVREHNCLSHMIIKVYRLRCLLCQRRCLCYKVQGPVVDADVCCHSGKKG